jgi:hypothetical protein
MGSRIGSVRRTAGIGLVAVIAVMAVGAAPAAADGSFTAASLDACVGFTSTDLMQAAEGTELPYAGLRLYRRDGARGRSVTYCLTLSATGSPQCCSTDALITLPRWLRRDAESMRLIVAPGCQMQVSLYSSGWKRFLVKKELHSRGHREPVAVIRWFHERSDVLSVIVFSFVV